MLCFNQTLAKDKVVSPLEPCFPPLPLPQPPKTRGLTDAWDQLRNEGLQDGVQLDGVGLIPNESGDSPPQWHPFWGLLKGNQKENLF